MKIELMEDEEFNRRLVRALEQAPEITVPADFALRVAAQVPARAMDGRVATAMPSVGTRMAWATAAMLLLTIFILAPSATGMGTRHWLEFVLEVEFIALAAWLSVGRLFSFR